MKQNQRDVVINKMIKKALGMYNGKYSKAVEMAIWSMCSDWNEAHPDEEIFMCEHGDKVVDGFCIEDDYFLYADMEA